MKKFLLGKAPFVRSTDTNGPSTNRIMIDVLIALAPIVIFAWIKNGLLPWQNDLTVTFWQMIYPLVLVLVGALSSFVFEAAYFGLVLKTKGFKNILTKTWYSFAIIPGIILALLLPLQTGIGVLVFGCFLANIVFKMLFGGFGHNIFNPALIAYAILFVSFGLGSSSLNLNPTEALNVTSGSTPLGNFGSVSTISYETVVAPYGNLFDFFLGMVPGCLGATSGLLCVVAYVYLVARKVINWKVPAIYVATFALVSLGIAAVNGYGAWYALFNVLSGGLLFGAVFMATEPVTTPKNPIASILFAVGLGILTGLFRYCGMYPDGVATGILVMCMFTPVLDRFGAVIGARRFDKNAIIKLSCVAVLYLGIAAYVILSAGGAN